MEVDKAALTPAEELEALGAAMQTQRTEAFAGEVIDITTGFTLGAARDAAAENLRDWVQSQLPCSEVTLDVDEDGLPFVHMDLGTLDDACEHRGRTYAGALSVTVVSVDLAGQVVLEHEWFDVHDGELSLTGNAQVTWDAVDGPLTRQVTYDGAWTSAAGVLDATGEVLQKPYEGDTFELGFAADGHRDWTAEDGRDWSMTAEGVAARWMDPVPETGRYTVYNPDGKEAVLSFERQDEDTIRVTLSGGWSDRVLDVTRTGVVLPVE